MAYQVLSSWYDYVMKEEKSPENVVQIPPERITRLIFLIRGKKVMFDRDLAELYGVDTKVLNQAVKRNSERFPADFMFKLNEQETKAWQGYLLRSQFVTLKQDPSSLSMSTNLRSQIVTSSLKFLGR